MAEVRLRNVSKAFGKVIAVDGFSIDIEDGEFIVLVGPSGCGKSTVLRAIAGLEEISSGEIYIGGRLVNDIHPRDRDIAMVFQNYALYPHMNVYENMSFSLKQRKLAKQEIDKIVGNTAKLLGIHELLERKPRQLSGGQRQRVALGRAIVRSPQVFLFDEPLSNLDAKLRIVMRAELLDLHQNLKTTSIYVTHDQVEAMTMGDRLVVMNQGRIQQVDTPQNLYDNPVNKFVAGFIGSPPMNFIDCLVAKEDENIFLKTDAMALRVPQVKASRLEPYVGKEVIVGLRPEHIVDHASTQEREKGATFFASVWMVEPLGSEKLIHLRCGDTTLVVRSLSQAPVRAGEKSEFTAMMDRAYVFKKDTDELVFSS